MSRENREGKRSARERLVAERERQRRRVARQRQLTVLGIVFVVIVAGVGIGLGVALTGGKSAPFGAPTGAVIDPYVNQHTHTNDATGISYGSADAPVTLSLFEDFRCPVCQVLETTGGAEVYKRFVAEGKLRVIFHPVKLIDEKDISDGTQASGSLEAGSAAACAQVEGKFDAFHDVLYANQPKETTDPWSSPSALITLAKKVPGLDSPPFEQCVKSGEYEGFVDQNWSDFNTFENFTGTPSLMLNGSLLPASDYLTATKNEEIANVAGLTTTIQDAINKTTGSSSNPKTSASPSTSSSAAGSMPDAHEVSTVWARRRRPLT